MSMMFEVVPVAGATLHIAVSNTDIAVATFDFSVATIDFARTFALGLPVAVANIPVPFLMQW